MVCPIPRSGKLGFVGDYTGATLTRYRRVRNWVFSTNGNPEARVYSGTRFGTQRIPGHIETVGSFSGFGATPPLFVGDTFTFIGYTAPTSGIPCTPGCAYTFLALVETLNITWNWTAENKGVQWTITFSSTEVPSVITNFDDPCDDNVYCDDNVCNLSFIMMNPCAGDAIIEFCNLVSASLTFNAKNTPYSNNSTNCAIRREVGTLDWTMEVIDQNPCIIPIIQADYWFEIRATVSPATSWILKYGQYQGASNFLTNVETGEIISKTNTFNMQAVNCCVPGSPIRGEIIGPDGTVHWPYSTPS